MVFFVVLLKVVMKVGLVSVLFLFVFGIYFFVWVLVYGDLVLGFLIFIVVVLMLGGL